MEKTKDPDMPIGKLKRVNDFLPPPDQLVLPQETTKVTIALTKSSVDFLKRQAKKHRTKYQRMIRELLDKYVGQYQSN